jgi:hypothetical protein
MTWYEKNMLSKDSMSEIDESANENNSLGKDSKTSNESNEDEVKHDPFESLMMTRFHFEDYCLI